MRVVVIGAGFSGLACAEELHRRGADVVVIEARERVGGRVSSMRLDGWSVERGAEFVLPGYEAMRAICDRLEVPLALKGMKYGDREPRGGPPVDRASLDLALRRVASVEPRPGQTVEEVLTALDLDPGAEAAIRARIEISNAHPADDLDAAVLAATGSGFGDYDSANVVGGNGLMAEALAAQLGDRVELESPVDRIRWSDDGVTVSSGDRSWQAERVVITVPPSVIDAVVFDPPLPGRVREALSRVVYGHAAKCFVPLRAEADPSAVMSVPGRFWTFTGLAEDGVRVPVCGSFAGTPDALDRLDVDGGAETWGRRIEELRPDLDLETDRAVTVTWRDDPWARGAYSAASPRTPADDRALWLAPVGPFLFAGEHTAGEWASTMEGALRSGLRAADAIVPR